MLEKLNILHNDKRFYRLKLTFVVHDSTDRLIYYKGANLVVSNFKFRERSTN